MDFDEYKNQLLTTIIIQFLINENIFRNIYRMHIWNWHHECIFY